MKFKTFILYKASRLLPMTFLATVILQINLCIYYLIYPGSKFGTWEHVDTMVSLWRLICVSLGIESGWSVVFEAGLVTWYISVLMLCYIVFYILTLVAKRMEISPVYMYIFMILLGIGINSYTINMPFLNAWSARGFYSFFYGLLFAKYKEKIEVYRWAKIGSILAVLFIIGIYFASCFVAGVRKIITGGSSEEVYILTFVLYPSLMIILNFPLFQKVFQYKFWRILGESSFDVYIWHMPLLVLFYNIMKLGGVSVDVHTVSCMIGFTFSVWIIGIASYYMLERKIKIFLADKIEKL